jgi:hypothetical protein
MRVPSSIHVSSRLAVATSFSLIAKVVSFAQFGEHVDGSDMLCAVVAEALPAANVPVDHRAGEG